MAKRGSDGSNCQGLFEATVKKMGAEARVARVLDAKAVGTTRTGKRPSDYFFSYKQFGAYIECKETSDIKFRFNLIKPHQLGLAKRCTLGGIHYIFPVLRMQTGELFLVHSAYLLHHIDKVRRSHATWEELEAFQCPNLASGYNMELLLRLVSSDVDRINAEVLAKWGIRSDIGYLGDT